MANMKTPSQIGPRALCRRLLAWYHVNRREMPWRSHPDPYAVWVSEIMLQQTRVDTVRPYFTRFLARFPTLADLAAADDDALLKQWEGLGYYSRARNLRQAAQQIVTQHGGELPRSVAALIALPGIGPYTAAAIASICFGIAEPSIDGNVIRVFARYWLMDDDFTKTASRACLAERLRPLVAAAAAPGDLNQAMMELGALVCTPRAPACTTCPLRHTCGARAAASPENFPRKALRKALPERHAAGVILRDRSGRLLLVKRAATGLLGGLWELPGGELPAVHTGADVVDLVRRQTGLVAVSPTAAGALRHTFSHFRLRLTLYRATVRVARLTATRRDHLRWTRTPDDLPLTTASRRALQLAVAGQ